MARLKVHYRLTFIDVDVEANVASRSLSCPPSFNRADRDCYDKDAEKRFMSLQMTKLEQRFQQLQSEVSAPEKLQIQPINVSITPVAAANCGSYGHPELCHRPCINFVKGECKSGGECNFCHLPHSKIAKFDKKQRELLAMLPKSTLLATILPHLRQRMVDHDHGKDVVEMLERELEFRPAAEVEGLVGLTRISKIMEVMPFMGLVGLVSSKVSGALSKQIRAAVQDLRADVLSLHS